MAGRNDVGSSPIPAIMTGLVLSVAGCATAPSATMATCDKACLEEVAAAYREAYLAHDTSLAPFAEEVRFTENNVEMPFPDGTWDTVNDERYGTPLILSDPVTGNVAIYTAITQLDTPGFLAIRLNAAHGEITEVEHIISTKRNLSSPPTPIGEDLNYEHDPRFDTIIPPEDRLTREELIAHGHGYLDTLEKNDGEIRGTQFSEDANRRENGLRFDDIGAGFRSGRYGFNDRVRREPVLVDEARQVVLMRGFIDHKGVLETVTLTTGEEVPSIYREPHSWGLLESFKIVDDHIVAVEAVFVGAPYYMTSPWTEGELAYGHVGARLNWPPGALL